MSTRFIKKRHRRVKPIGHARLREAHILHGKHRQHRLLNYPLYKSCNEIYNFNNLKESLENWDNYSSDTKTNMKQVVSILNLMDKHGASSQDLREATRIICNDILEYTADLNKYKPLFESINSENLKDTKEAILNKIDEANEMDRVVSNFKELNEELHFEEYFKESLKTDSLKESLYKLCDKLEYDGLASDFCIMTEAILYSLDGYSKVPIREVTEGIIDYYLEKYNDNIEEFVPTIRRCIEADEFIPNEASDYIDYVEYIIEDRNLLVESTFEHFQDKRFSLIEDYNENMKTGYYEALKEVAIVNRAKEIFTKFKSLPNKTFTMATEAIRALYVTRRLQDIKKNTRNALAIAFYCLAAASGFVLGWGAIGGILTLIFSLTVAQSSNREYLQEALEEWREHRHMVEKKIAASHDSKEKTRLSHYLEEVDKNIGLLEKEYEERRDRTSKEIEDDVKHKVSSSDYQHSGSLINPLGDYPSDEDKDDTKKGES